MDVFKPIKRTFVPRSKAPATLALPANENEPPPDAPDVEVTEMQGEDGWQEWQDSVMVDEFTNDALQTIPGELK